MVVEDRNPGSPFPNSQGFFTQNGGEARLSYKGFAPGYARMIMSPAKFSIQAMQIDTWNRNAMNLTGISWLGLEWVHLLRHFPAPDLSPRTACSSWWPQLPHADSLLRVLPPQKIPPFSSPSIPFSSCPGPTAFVAGPTPRSSYASPNSPYSGLLECPMTSRVTKDLDAEHFVQLRSACGDEVGSEAECAAVVTTLAPPGFSTTVATVSNASLPGGCSFAVAAGARRLTASFNTQTPPASPALCGRGLTALLGAEKSLVELSLGLDQASPNATITLTGPDGVWFGVGFNARAMSSMPWTVIVDGAGGVTERKLATHDPGALLPRSVHVVSNTVTAGNRTVVLTRRRQGAHFNFSFSQTALPFIAALGSGPQFAIHKSEAEATLTLLATDAPNCVCAKDPAPFGQGGGYFVYEDGSRVAFKNECVGQVLEQRNPTCDLRTYTGGIQTCALDVGLIPPPSGAFLGR